MQDVDVLLETLSNEKREWQTAANRSLISGKNAAHECATKTVKILDETMSLIEHLGKRVIALDTENTTLIQDKLMSDALLMHWLKSQEETSGGNGDNEESCAYAKVIDAIKTAIFKKPSSRISTSKPKE